MLMFQMLVIYLPWLQRVFQTEALSLGDLAFISFVAASMVVLDTVRKVLFPDRPQDSPVGYFSLHVAACFATVSTLLAISGQALP